MTNYVSFLEKSESLNVHLTTIAHEKDINSICVSPNDKFIATGSMDKTAKVSIVVTSLASQFLKNI